jgi:hypothetical protein
LILKGFGLVALHYLALSRTGPTTLTPQSTPLMLCEVKQRRKKDEPNSKIHVDG